MLPQRGNEGLTSVAMRHGELRWSDVDLGSNVIRVARGLEHRRAAGLEPDARGSVHLLPFGAFFTACTGRAVGRLTSLSASKGWTHLPRLPR